jgi:hypothetical protein
MGTRADFYLGTGANAKWIGSLFKDGHPWNIPPIILLQINPIGFEEEVIEYLEKKESVISDKGDKWPWPWPDSQLTDYSYIFSYDLGRVIAVKMDGTTFDPIKIIQGEDLKTAELDVGTIKFPLMNLILFEDRM